jgi:hypothetical protein
LFSLTGALTRSWTLKLSAFGLALLVWVAVTIEVPTLQEISGIPVRVNLLDPQWALLEDPAPPTVTVRFAGPARELIRLGFERPTISIPLGAVATGDTVIVLNPAWISVHGRTGVEIENIQPSSVRILLQPIERRAFPPAIRLEGTLPESLALALYPVADPPEIRVSGPRSRLAEIESIPLVPIDLSAISSPGSYLARVDTTALIGLEIQPRELSVLLQFEERITASVNDIPVRLPGTLQEEGGLLLRFSTATAVIQGARSVVDAIDPLGLTLVADTTGAPLPAPGEETELSLTLLGLSPLLSGEARPETVTVRNVEEDGI